MTEMNTVSFRRSMTVILKNGGMFLHIPKTGGNWVTKVLEKNHAVAGRIGHKHDSLERILTNMNGGGWEGWSYALKKMTGAYPRSKPYMFCFVRHPLSWYESYFKYMSQPSRNWCPWYDEHAMTAWQHPCAMLNGLGASDFNQFIRNVIEKRPGYVSELFGWYTRPQVDFVGKQENLKEDVIHVFRELGLDCDEEDIRSFPEFGVSKKPDQHIVWDPALKKEMLRLEHAAIVRYGYEE